MICSLNSSATKEMQKAKWDTKTLMGLQFYQNAYSLPCMTTKVKSGTITCSAGSPTQPGDSKSKTKATYIYHSGTKSTGVMLEQQ